MPPRSRRPPPSDPESGESLAPRDWGGFLADPRTIADAIGHPAVLCDPDGRLLHETPALRDLLSADPEAERLRSALLELLASRAAGAGKGTVASPEPHGEVRTRSARYLLRTRRIASDGLEAPPLVVGTVERRDPAPRSSRELQRSFSLTAREATVALLLARGMPNEEIARTLVISPHTARRHTERVLRKLGARSRSEIASRVLY